MAPDNGQIYRITIGSRNLRDGGLAAFLEGNVAPGSEEVHGGREN